MRHLSRIGLLEPASRQTPFLEFADNGWRIWVIHKQIDGILVGTYIKLCADGAVLRVTTDKMGQTTDVVVVNGEQK